MNPVLLFFLLIVVGCILYAVISNWREDRLFEVNLEEETKKTESGTKSDSGPAVISTISSKKKPEPEPSPQVTIYAYHNRQAVRICPKCDGENHPYAAFCKICGQRIR